MLFFKSGIWYTSNNFIALLNIYKQSRYYFNFLQKYRTISLKCHIRVLLKERQRAREGYFNTKQLGNLLAFNIDARLYVAIHKASQIYPCLC